jgi:hypothetical protein
MLLLQLSNPWKGEKNKIMNIYYTAKDIEELVSRGIYELELGPHTSLTDFARETAEQLDVILIDAGQELEAPARQRVQSAVSQAGGVIAREAYNKPRGCQVGPRSVHPGSSAAANPAPVQTGSTPTNRLVDLMGKIINRGD